MKIAVGSTNPKKSEATHMAFAKVWPDQTFEVVGVDVKSGISDQPMSDLESMKGAKQRAKLALEATPDAEYGVGLEGGMQEIDGAWYDSGWVAVIDKQGNIGLGSSARCIVPEKMMVHIRQGMELGHVDDLLFGHENSKQKSGHFGFMTNEAIPRAEGYRDGVIMALARFIVPQLFDR